MSVDELVSAITTWAAKTLPGREPVLSFPGEVGESEGVFLSFIAFRPVNDLRSAMPRRDPVVDILEVDLMLTIAVPDPLEQARLVADLHFAALQGNTSFLLVAPSEARELLRDVGATPDRSLVLRGRIARERAAKAVPVVREAIFELRDKARGTTEPADGG